MKCGYVIDEELAGFDDGEDVKEETSKSINYLQQKLKIEYK